MCMAKISDTVEIGHCHAGHEQPPCDRKRDCPQTVAPALFQHRQDAESGLLIPLDGPQVSPLTTGTDPSASIIAFSSKDHGADAETDLSPTLRAGGHDGSHANAGVPPAIAYGITRDAIDRSGEAEAGDAAGRSGLGITEELAQTIKAKGPGAVAFSIMPMNSGTDFKGRETDIAQPVMAAGPAGPAGVNQGGDYIVQPVLFALRGREGGAMPEVHDQVSALRAASGGATRDFVALQGNMIGRSPSAGPAGPAGPGIDASGAMFTMTKTDVHAVASASAVRRLTPRECARLQGFPDDYLDIIHRGRPAADGPKYKALGNSMAVPVMAWIGLRIQMLEDLENPDA